MNHCGIRFNSHPKHLIDAENLFLYAPKANSRMTPDGINNFNSSVISPLGMTVIGVFFGVLVATIATNETFWPALMGLFALIVGDFATLYFSDIVTALFRCFQLNNFYNKLKFFN